MSATASTIHPSWMEVENWGRASSHRSVDSGYYSDTTTDKDHRSSTPSLPSRNYIFDLADTRRPTPPTSTTSSRVQNHPGTLKCNLYSRRFTRTHSLRSHRRTHREERPFVYTGCVKAFALQHERRRHESLHSGEKRYTCKGELGSGRQWGCGRRVGRAEDLGRHFQSEAGRGCIKPLLEEEAAERDGNRIHGQQNKYLVESLQPALGGFVLPAALLAQYPALNNIDWSSMPPGEDPEEESSTGVCSITKPALEHPHQQQQSAQAFRFDLNSHNFYPDVNMDLPIDPLLLIDEDPFCHRDKSPEISKSEMDQTSFPNSSSQCSSSHSSELTQLTQSSASGHSVLSPSSSTAGSPYIGHTHSFLQQGSWVNSNEGLSLSPAVVNHHQGFVGTYPDSELEFGKEMFSNGQMQTLMTSPKLYTENELPLVDDNINACFEKLQGRDKPPKEASARPNANCHDSLLSSEAPRAIAVLSGSATGPNSTLSQGLKKVHNEFRTALLDTNSTQDPFYADRHPGTEHEDNSFPSADSEMEVTSVQASSTTGESRETHWPRSTEAPQGDFPLELYVDNADADVPPEALDCQDRVASCYGPLPPCNQIQKYCGSLFHNGPESHSRYGDPSSLASLSVREAASAVVPRVPSSSLHPTTNLISYPNMGYDLVSDIYAATANTQVTGSAVEIGDAVNDQLMLMLSNHRTSSSQLLPLPRAEMTQHMPNDVDHPVGFKVPSNIGLTSEQGVWDLTTGDSVPMRKKRSLSDAGRADSQIIRQLSGQCGKCKKIRGRSKASATSPSPLTCSDFESSFILVSTSKGRETDQLHVHAQRHGQSLGVNRRQQGTHSVSGAADGDEDNGKLSEGGPSPLSADETSLEPESDGGYESTTERSILSCSQKDMISRLMDEICSSFFFQLSRGPRQRGPKSGESFSSNDTQTSVSTNNSYENGSSVRRGKRARNDEDPNDERGHKRKRRPSKESFSSDLPLAEIRYFACPFHKFDMSTYSDRNGSPDLALKYRSCGPPGRPTIGRMKEHLYRTHQTPIHCPRCWTVMKTEAELGEHARANLQCQILPQPLRWIPREVVTKLKDRKKAFAGQTDEDTWRYIYGLLFPDSVHIPSPYYDEDVALEGRDANASPTWQAIAAYEEYARAHLPRLVEEALETAVAEQTQPIEESLRRALAGIVRDCQARLAQDFLHRRSANQGDAGLLQVEALPSFYIEPLNLADETLLLDTEYTMPNDPPPPRPHTDSGYGSINQAPNHDSGELFGDQSLRNGASSSDDPFSDGNDAFYQNMENGNMPEDCDWTAICEQFDDEHPLDSNGMHSL